MFNCIQLNKVGIKDTRETARSTPYIYIHIKIDSNCRLRTKHYDKRDNLNCHIVILPFIRSNIPAASASPCGVHTSELIRYFRASGSDQELELLLSRELLINELLLLKLMSSLRKFYGRHGHVPVVVSTSCFSFFITDLSSQLVAEATRQVSLVGLEQVLFQSPWVHPQFSVRFMLPIFIFLCSVLLTIVQMYVLLFSSFCKLYCLSIVEQTNVFPHTNCIIP